ncbi:hypothetical protein Z043_109555 [Scleropages formosus]|uniref:CUB domain-containing protein n=1 Tax=Scleropages formosus TaxID=113540 RepID=A0A0P7UBS6_SCLFO|nr:hypothetical protein Z043_109555 [Scleropages formosus]
MCPRCIVAIDLLDVLMDKAGLGFKFCLAYPVVDWCPIQGLFLVSSVAGYDFVEIEEPGEATVLGRWCGSQAKPGNQVSRGNQIRIRFVSDEFFPSEPGFSVRYSLLSVVSIELQ